MKGDDDDDDGNGNGNGHDGAKEVVVEGNDAIAADDEALQDFALTMDRR